MGGGTTGEKNQQVQEQQKVQPFGKSSSYSSGIQSW
jgi:hypothetical protein